MTKEELIEKLKECQTYKDQEEAHIVADDALLEYIDDEDIEEEYKLIDKWYA